MSLAYYNEFDPFAAAWLRELTKADHIAAGAVDERSIEDAKPNELQWFTQCHFFAGIGVWSYALRAAGWPDNRPVWTVSCPCQPFSASGKKSGFADERHLWPAFYHVLKEYCAEHHPPVLIGEQVAGKDALPWIDLVQADLEALGYAFGCVPFPSAGIGAPHIRDRAYWVAYSSSQGLAQRVSDGRVQRETVVTREGQTPVSSGDLGGLANPYRDGCGQGWEGIPETGSDGVERNGTVGRLADDKGSGRGEERQDGSRGAARDRTQGESAGSEPGGSDSRSGPTNGFWADADWLFCRDGKWRPVEPGTFPLAHGAPARVGRLRGYGNAINAEAARVWVETVMEVLG